MVKELLPDNIGISVSYPLPGTKFYDKVKDDLQLKANWKDSDDLDLMVNKIQSSISKEKKSETGINPSLENPIHQIRLENGLSYWGENKNGIPHGYGKKKLGKSTTYQGEFVMGLEHGYGTSFGKDGKISFQGQWKEGLPFLPKKEFVRDLTNY